MAKVLVLGVGLQGRAVVHDLMRCPEIGSVVAADVSREQVLESLAGLVDARRGQVEAVAVDASQEEALTALLEAERPDVVVCMLPPRLGPRAARLALRSGAHYVSTSYTGALSELDVLAREQGLAVLPEMGLDPGLDLVLCRLALDELDEVHGLEAYGGGIPEPACADDNPLRYKVSWTFEGVLDAYVRTARRLVDGQEQLVERTEIFHPSVVSTEEVDGVGTLEAYPNGDALSYIEAFGLGTGLRDMGRYSLRWPGHCAFWYPLVQLGLLDEAPTVLCGGVGFPPRKLLAEHLGPRLQFRADERDLVVLRVRARGLTSGARREVVLDVVDFRDLETGFFAMNRTVGYTASIGAQMLLSGEIERRGVLSPTRDVPPGPLLEALETRGIIVTKHAS